MLVGSELQWQERSTYNIPASCCSWSPIVGPFQDTQTRRHSETEKRHCIEIGAKNQVAMKTLRSVGNVVGGISQTPVQGHSSIAEINNDCI
jgi:hypothetical protein